MSVSKEKCLKACSDIKMANNYPTSKYNDNRVIESAVNIFEQLINEHFDFLDKHEQKCLYECSVKNNIMDIYNHIINPPLQLEELEIGMIVWDKIIRMYMKVIEKNENKIVIMDTISMNSFELYFEDDRFYRKQVKDNE